MWQNVNNRVKSPMDGINERGRSGVVLPNSMACLTARSNQACRFLVLSDGKPDTARLTGDWNEKTPQFARQEDASRDADQIVWLGRAAGRLPGLSRSFHER